jgi:hypothetical protein
MSDSPCLTLSSVQFSYSPFFLAFLLSCLLSYPNHSLLTKSHSRPSAVANVSLSYLRMSDPSATPVGSTFMTSSPPPHSNQEAVNPFPEETSFEEGQIVMLSIPAKLRQSTKSAKLPCRVTGKVNKVYSLATSINQTLTNSLLGLYPYHTMGSNQGPPPSKSNCFKWIKSLLGRTYPKRGNPRLFGNPC